MKNKGGLIVRTFCALSEKISFGELLFLIALLIFGYFGFIVLINIFFG